ncbi:MAG: S41 family peptidase, partial [Candidatus Subteraquimicrobiales bacterium]|nr:S41 family peptidase [Candidatus Subteraquimicrobiales bacterium]
DGKITKSMSVEKAVSLIRGEEGTVVILAISREGAKETLEFELIREKIKYPNVVLKMLEKDIGYIRVHFFYGDTSADVKEALDRLKKEGAKGLILDLRSNPGGLLGEAVDTASLFIESGVIVVEKYRDGGEVIHKTTGGADEKIPLVILVNKGSASASEIVAGAFQDRERAKLVGEKTFGKGCVQSVETLSDGSAIVITVATYFTPRGKSVHKEGITPDYVVELKDDGDNKVDEQLEKAKEVLKKEIPPLP